MAVEFSTRPFSPLLLSLRLSIFNPDCSCNWLEGQRGGTLLVGRHTDHSAPAPLFLSKSIFCCNAEISPVDFLPFIIPQCASGGSQTGLCGLVPVLSEIQTLVCASSFTGVRTGPSTLHICLRTNITFISQHRQVLGFFPYFHSALLLALTVVLLSHCCDRAAHLMLVHWTVNLLFCLLRWKLCF